MPPREWRLYVDDILASIARIEEYTHGLEFDEFEEGETTTGPSHTHH